MRARRIRKSRHACLPAVLRVLTIGAAAASFGAARAQAPEPQHPGQQAGQQPGRDPGAAGGESAPAGQQRTTPFVRGQLTSRYWLRWTGNQNDSDIYETLLLDVGDENRDTVTGHFYGRLAVDLDGDTNGTPPFFSLADLHDSVDAHVYEAFADVHRIEQVELLRIGRQTIYETPEIAFFDGVQVRTAPLSTAGMQFGGYGGLSTHLYESAHSGDWTAGLYGECRPWDGGRLRLDWMHLEDEALLGAHADDVFAAGVWHSFQMAQLEAQYSRVEDRDRDVRARGSWSDPVHCFTGQLTWYQLLTTQRSEVLELDPFFNATHELFPYWQFGALVGKGLLDRLDVDAGTDVRRVSDNSDVGTFNRDYDHWFLNVNLRDVWHEGLTLTATADFWNGEGQDVQTWAGELSQRCNDGLTVSAGSYYSLYKFSLYANDERDHVRTYFGKVRYIASSATEFDLAYEFERTDIDDFQVLRMGFTWNF